MRTSPHCTIGGGEPWRRDISAERSNHRFHVKQPKRTCKSHEFRVRVWFMFSLRCPEICVVVSILKPECVHCCWTHSCILSNGISTHLPIIWLLCRLVCVFPYIHADRQDNLAAQPFCPWRHETQKCTFNYFLKLAGHCFPGIPLSASNCQWRQH